jgi:hypothetical protein
MVTRNHKMTRRDHKKHFKLSKKLRITFFVTVPVMVTLSVSTIVFTYNKFIDVNTSVNIPKVGVVTTTNGKSNLEPSSQPSEQAESSVPAT